MPSQPSKTESTASAPREMHPVLSGFHTPVREWFHHSFPEPTRVQQLAWPVIQSGESTLILAPTGSGKTLAAFLAAIDRVMFDPAPPPLERCRVLYISPLKALAVDVERNLRAPLVGVSRYAERMGIPVHEPRVGIRTGDTPSKERQDFIKHPSDILITTPESLYLMLTSNAREPLRHVRWVIVDEIHAMVGTKRGVHLSLSLERLEELTKPQNSSPSRLGRGAEERGGVGNFQRIGLSATQRPLDEVARFLGGFSAIPIDVPGAMPIALDGHVGPIPPPADPITAQASPPVSANEIEADLAGEVRSPQNDSAGDVAGHPSPPGRGAGGEGRPVRIVDAGSGKRLDLRVEVPVEDMARLADPIDIPSGDASQGTKYASIWPAIHPLILNLIRQHRSTLIFVNSRRLAERLAGALNDLAAVQESPIIGAEGHKPGPPYENLAYRTRGHYPNQPSADSDRTMGVPPVTFDDENALDTQVRSPQNWGLGGRSEPPVLVRAHHGSIAREQRAQIEDDLKSGRLPAMVATSSLELGIDMGAIDLVIQVEAPPSVSSALQRIGRAGHQVGAPSEGVIIPKYRGDLLACAALTERMVSGAVEQMKYPRNALDVLAQQIVAMVAVDDWRVDELEAVIRRAAPFAELPRSMYLGVLDMLSGRYPSDDFAELRPRITWDRLAGMLTARQGAKRVAITNPGTIPDRGLYGVFLVGAEKGKGRVGELDEEMVFESHVGDIFHLGASSWRIEEITFDRVLVSPASGEPGRMPFWHGESVGRPIEFGRAIGALSRKLLEMPDDDATRELVEKHFLTEVAARNLLQYLNDQKDADGLVPDDRTIVVESYQDELGDWRVCILSPFGAKVHAPWAMAIAAMVRTNVDADVDVLWTDDGIVVRFPEADEPPPIESILPDPEEAEDLVVQQLGSGGGARQAGQGSPAVAIFTSHFREAAGRALLLPRKHPGQRAPLWQQRKRAADLLKATMQFGSFPIILETFRECLRDVFDMPALVDLLTQIRNRDVKVVPVTNVAPSPFASSLLFNYVANFIYEGDAPLAERRAQALSVDPSQLRELLGEIGLRDLLDPDALEQLELYLQHLTPERAVKHVDGLHDLLIRLGDLSMGEIAARVVDAFAAGRRGESTGAIEENATDTGFVQPGGSPAPLTNANADDRVPSDISDGLADAAQPSVTPVRSPHNWGLGGQWIDELVRQRRAVPLTIAGERRYIAAEDMGRYRDAIGIPPPQGLPEAFLEYIRDPLGDLVARFARTHGPFAPIDIAQRYGIGVGPIMTVLQKMESAGKLIEGEFRPGGSGREYCDAGVLRALRQKSLARLRKEVEPVDPAALGRLYLNWQHVESPRRGRNALFEAIAQIQGVPIPASVLETQVLPARVHDYHPRDLDLLMSSGTVIWVGCDPLGSHDGRIALYLAEDADYLLRPPSTAPSPKREVALMNDASADGVSVRSPQNWGLGGQGLQDRIRRHLSTRGASFFPQIQQATGGFPPEVVEALWDLVWAGEVTNDTLQPLRAVVDGGDSKSNTPEARARAKVRHMRPGSRRAPLAARTNIPAEAVGRWFLVSDLVPSNDSYPGAMLIALDEHATSVPLPTDPIVGQASLPVSSDIESALDTQVWSPQDWGLGGRGLDATVSTQDWGLGGQSPSPDDVTHTERIHARVNQLLERYGVLTREAVQAEGISGGFSSIYGVLKAMEDSGLIRRGYFVSGLGATQFALPGAVDRLRALREPPDRMQTAMLSATDPANPYGAALPWPDVDEGRRPMRQAGAFVFLVDGALAAWMPRSERQLITFLDNVPDRDPSEVAYEIAKTLADLVTSLRRRAVLIEEVNGRPPRETPMGQALMEAGFAQSSQGFQKRL